MRTNAFKHKFSLLQLSVSIAVITMMFFALSSIVFAGSGGGGGGGGSDSQKNVKSCGTGCTTYTENGRTYRSTSGDYNGDGDIRDANEFTTSCMDCGSSGGSSGGRVVTPTPSPSTCAAQPNLRTIDIFFIPAGARPTPQRSQATAGRYGSSIVSSVLANPNPYFSSMVARNELEVGLSYEPVAVIRNVATCTSGRLGSLDSKGAFALFDFQKLASLFIKTAYAGSRSSSVQPNDYPNYVRSQSPFGTNGSFPIRARIDVGNNTTYEWEHYINAFGPLGNGQTIYLRLPVFSTVEGGSHTIEVVTDIRHNVDAGRGCYAATTPASAGWGCVRETSETDNDRSEAFTATASNASLRLAVDVSDVTVRAGSVLSEVPFIIASVGQATINDYRYRVMINGTQFSSTTRTTTLAPSARETVRASGNYTAPATPTSLPLMVCARVATSSEVCDTARLIVATPQCSDARDNDTDGTQDTNDPGCFDDPLDPTTYDPNDDNEGDMATTSPSVTIEFRPVVNPVRYNTGAALEYVINGPAPMTCVVTGGGTNSPITHTPPRTTGQVTTAPVTSTQQYTLRCTANVGSGTLQFERTTIVDVLPQIQET